MVSTDEVKASMLKCFPKCPICNQSKGYDVLGANKDYVACNYCWSTWQSDNFCKGEKLSTLKLTGSSKNGTADFLLRKTFSVDFWQNWRMEVKAEREKAVREVITLFANEEIKEIIPSKYDRSFRTNYMGFLVLTTQRLFFIMNEYFSTYKIIIGIRYEEITSQKCGETGDVYRYCLKINDLSGTNYLFKVRTEQELEFLDERIVELTNKNRIRIEQEKKGKRVQIVLDFSSLRPLIEKGITLQVLRCPYCGGKIDALPSSGEVFECNYCGNKIHAIDIFREINRLVDSKVEHEHES